MQIIPVYTNNRRLVRQFLELPFRIYKDTPQWVPPLSADAKRMLDRRKNPFYQHSQAAFFLAVDSSGQAAGRIAVLDNHNYNTYNQERTAFFYLFECRDEPQTAEELFAAACQWARSRNLDRIVGPRGFSTLDGLGLLVRGFEHRPAFGLPYNPPYYPALLEKAGFEPQEQVVSGYLHDSLQFPEKIHQVADLVKRRRGLRVEQYRTRRELRLLVPHLKDLYNHSLGGTQGNVPLTDAEAKILADQLLWFADPRLIKIIYKEDEPVGFLFAYPDISAALQRTRGRLWPFGWLDILLELKRTRWVNINGAGILEKYRGLGGTALLFSEMYRSIQAGHFQHAELVQIGVSNDAMLRELRDLGVNFYKAHCLYCRAL